MTLRIPVPGRRRRPRPPSKVAKGTELLEACKAAERCLTIEQHIYPSRRVSNTLALLRNAIAKEVQR